MEELELGWSSVADVGIFLNLNLMCAVFNNTICFVFFFCYKFFLDKSNPSLDFSVSCK